MRVTARALLCLFVLSCAPGCASVALTAGGLMAGAGVNHTLSGIAYKTFTAPLDQLHIATVKSLEYMDIDLVDMNETAPGWKIHATAIDRRIDIELEPISANASRIRVVAKKGDSFIRDSSTAAEIIVQTAQKLEQMRSARLQQAPQENQS